MRLKILFFGFAAVCLSNPAFATSGFVVLHAPRGFAMGTMPHGGIRHAFHPYGLIDGGVALDTLATGTFNSAPDVSPDMPLPPYLPPGYYLPAYYRPPHACFKPLVIDLVPPQKPAGKLPRIVYGTNPPNCPDQQTSQ